MLRLLLLLLLLPLGSRPAPMQHSTRTLLSLLGLRAVAAGSEGRRADSAPPELPSFLFILADDIGWAVSQNMPAAPSFQAAPLSHSSSGRSH